MLLLVELSLTKEGMHFLGDSAVSPSQQVLHVHLYLHRRLGVSVHRAEPRRLLDIFQVTFTCSHALTCPKSNLTLPKHRE